MTEQTENLVGQLLSLAQMDAGRPKVTLERVWPNSMVEDVWGGFQHAADEKGAGCTLKLEATSTVVADRECLRIVLRNLIDNAVSYVDRDGAMEIATEDDGDSVRITITNSGATLEPEDLRRVGDRFCRGDQQRSATGYHAGLGLAICKALAERIDGRLTLEVDQESRFVATLILPMADRDLQNAKMHGQSAIGVAG